MEPKHENGDTNSMKSVESQLKDVEDQGKRIPYPRSIPFIVSNEFCERFNYYGLRTILVIYLTRQLDFNDDDATVLFHVFTMLVYFMCIFGAIISDSWLGKFRTILYLSIAYAVGSVFVAVGAIPNINVSPLAFTIIGLLFITLGSGGIKPCVSAFGGDQFKLPEQTAQVATFFSIFYFAINAGSLISTTLTPILREDVHCFGERECFSLAFGVPAVLMALSIVIFILGRPLYKTKPPSGNMVVLVSKTVWTAIVTKFRERKTNPREHWLDYADNKFDKQLVKDVKVLTRVLLLYLPLPIFWALFDQQGSRWTLQATRMDGDFGSFDIKPDQVQLLNPLLILVFIPLYEVAFYPLLNLVGIRRPLQKLTLGGIFAGIAFVCSGLVELQLEATYPVLPSANNAQLRIFNAENCAYTFKTNVENLPTFTVPSGGYYMTNNINFPGKSFAFTYTITADGSNCAKFDSGSRTFQQSTSYGMFLGSQTSTPVWYIDDVKKPSSGASARTLANLPATSTVQWTRDGYADYNEPASVTTLTSFSNGEYTLSVNNVPVGKVTLKAGAIYTVVVSQDANYNFKIEQYTITEPNTLNILWLIPQYVIMTLGEVMFSVTGIEFSYAQAPTSMKSVLQACWQLTIAFGNLIVVIIAEVKLFDRQSSEFFLFAGLMFADMLIFMVLAWKYVPNDPNEVSASEPLTKPLELVGDEVIADLNTKL